MPTFDSRGFPIYYEVHGGGRGIPLVLVMGLAGTCEGWLPLTVPALSKSRENVIFDNRGAGKSGDPEADYTTAEMAEDTVALLDHLHVERANLLGGFMGGMVAQEVAIAHPERVNALVLGGSYARADGRRRALLEVWGGLVEYGAPVELQVKNRLAWTLHDLTFEQDEVIEALTSFYARDDAPIEEKSFLRQIRACIGHDTLARLDRIEAPTLVVAGERDLLTPPHMQRELATHIPNARLVLIRGAGHVAAVEAAGRFNRLVARFLDEYDRPAEDDWSR